LRSTLSPFEFAVLEQYLIGKSYKETAKVLGERREEFPDVKKIDSKSVDNALNRVRKGAREGKVSKRAMQMLDSKQRILSAIHELHEGGGSIHHNAVRNRHPELYEAVKIHPGLDSWGSAVYAAGLRPQKPRKYQTKADIIRALGAFKRENSDISARNVGIYDSALYKNAIRLFDGWHNALEAAGFDPLEHDKRQDWNKDILTERLRELEGTGLKITASSLRRAGHQDVISAVIRHFGSWQEAREAAGLKRVVYDRAPRWSRQKLIGRIRELHENGIRITSDSLKDAGHRDVGSAINNKVYFNSWYEAREAADVPHPPGARKPKPKK
jgi:hypothetical protein